MDHLTVFSGDLQSINPIEATVAVTETLPSGRDESIPLVPDSGDGTLLGHFYPLRSSAKRVSLSSNSIAVLHFTQENTDLRIDSMSDEGLGWDLVRESSGWTKVERTSGIAPVDEVD